MLVASAAVVACFLGLFIPPVATWAIFEAALVGVFAGACAILVKTRKCERHVPRVAAIRSCALGVVLPVAGAAILLAVLAATG